MVCESHIYWEVTWEWWAIVNSSNRKHPYAFIAWGMQLATVCKWGSCLTGWLLDYTGGSIMTYRSFSHTKHFSYMAYTQQF